jgi:uncharacterized protein (DUF697 family)
MRDRLASNTLIPLAVVLAAGAVTASAALSSLLALERYACALDREASRKGHDKAGQSKEIKRKLVASRHSCGYC